MTVRRLIVEADGGSRGNPGPAAYGALVRDAETGELLTELGESIGTATNNVAEYEGLLAGLRAAVRIDPDCRVEVRMDSKLVIEQMSGRWSIKHEDMRRLAGAAREVLPASRVRFTWVPRAQNEAADRLANQVLDTVTGVRRRGLVVTLPLFEPDADLGEPTTLLLIRHGSTVDTDQRRVRGSAAAGPGLTAEGLERVRRLAQRLAEHSPTDPAPRPAALITSPLLRAGQTAAALGDALGLTPIADDDWAEVSLGDWDGLDYAEIAARWPAEYRAWRGSTSAAPPHGESLDEVGKRVAAARDRLIRQYPGRRVLVVSHTAPIRTVLSLALDAGPVALWRLRIDPAGLSVVRFWADGGCEVAAVNSADPT